MQKLFYFEFALFLSFLVGCNITQKQQKDTTRNSNTIVKKAEVPYTIAKRYFIKNDVKEVPNKITNKNEFDKYFGKATVMGKNGQSTKIDFNKEFVIAVATKAVEREIKLEPVSLIKEDNQLLFEYTITEGQETSHTSHPFLLLIVPKDMDGDLYSFAVQAIIDGHNTEKSLD